jgi:hypothetical protein
MPLSTEIEDDYWILVYYVNHVDDVGERRLAQEALDRMRRKAEFNLEAVLKRMKEARLAKAVDDDRKNGI